MTKQEQLRQKKQLLSQTKSENAAAKAEKQQQTLFEKLQNELPEMEQQSAQQQHKIAHSDQDSLKQQ